MRPVLLLLVASALSAQTVDYRIESGGDNRLTLEVEKTGLMKGKKHLFDFPKFSGKLAYDAQAPANTRVELKIDATGVTTKDTWLGPKDLKKVSDYTVNDVLMTKQYPEIRFQSTKVTAKGAGQFSIEGTLTIRGNGKPVVLDAKLDAGTMVIDGKGVFKLTGYGIKPPSAALGAVGTKDDVTASFHVTVVK
ncbi:MAG: YceI family protein [Acidobacteria bacterium]|nr:YceI family protein [Acidobacteriota bacterium]